MFSRAFLHDTRAIVQSRRKCRLRHARKRYFWRATRRLLSSKKSRCDSIGAAKKMAAFSGLAKWSAFIRASFRAGFFQHQNQMPGRLYSLSATVAIRSSPRSLVLPRRCGMKKRRIKIRHPASRLNRQMRIAEAMNAVINDACRRQCRRRQIAGPGPPVTRACMHIPVS